MEDRAQKALIKRLNLCLKRPENLVCVDCPMRLPRWASLNLGVFMCTNCSGIHRGLGVHISRVRSTQLDKWTEDQVSFMERMGNVRANEYWEKNIVPGAKPTTSDLNVVERYIRRKYERKEFADRNAEGPIPDAQGGGGAAPTAQPAAPAPAAPAPAAAVASAAPAAGGGMFDLLDLAAPAAPAAPARARCRRLGEFRRRPRPRARASPSHNRRVAERRRVG
jgi:stromal membrane-associated protein